MTKPGQDRRNMNSIEMLQHMEYRLIDDFRLLQQKIWNEHGVYLKDVPDQQPSAPPPAYDSLPHTIPPEYDLVKWPLMYSFKDYHREIQRYDYKLIQDGFPFTLHHVNYFQRGGNVQKDGTVQWGNIVLKATITKKSLKGLQWNLNSFSKPN